MRIFIALLLGLPALAVLAGWSAGDNYAQKAMIFIGVVFAAAVVYNLWPRLRASGEQ